MRTFYDLTCPFCYLAQPFNKQLLKSGMKLTELPYQAHPDVPPEGTYIGPRRGPMYDNIAARAKASNLPLNWRDTLPNSRLALAAAEWVRQNDPDKADEVREKLFHAHFAGDQNIGELNVVVDVAKKCGVDGGLIEQALRNQSAFKLVDEAQKTGRSLGVRSTPTWESNGEVISGLQEGAVRHLAVMESQAQ